MDDLFNHTIFDYLGSTPSSGRECGRIEGPSDRMKLIAAISVLACLFLLLLVAFAKQNWDWVKWLIGAIQQLLARIPSLLGKGQPEGEADVELGQVAGPPCRSAGVPRNRSDDEILASPNARLVRV